MARSTEVSNTFLPLYGTGFFSLSLQKMNALLVLLWALELGASPFMIGLAASAGSILPVFFSISAGSFIDRLGSKRILLFCSAAVILITILQPILPYIAILILLQLFYGQAQSINWIATQTYAAKSGRQTPNHPQIGTFTFFVNSGTFAGPLLVGIFWDMVGPWGGFSVMVLWAAALFIFSKLLPDEFNHERKGNTEAPTSFRPGWKDYQKAFSLLAIPLVFLVVYATFLRLAGYAIQGSFYLVYLEQLSFPAATISFLYSFLSLTGVFAPLLVNFFARWVEEKILLFLAIITGILPLVFTPLFDQFLSFIVLAAISGIGIGLTLPLLISVLSGAVDPAHQGLAIGLRVTANRLASAVIPIVFGLFVEGIGLRLSFFVVGALLLGPMIIIAPILLRKASGSPPHTVNDPNQKAGGLL